MNCDILTKSGKFQFVKLDPSILNFNCRRLDIKEFFKKLKYCYDNIILDPIIKEINETNYYEIIVFKPNRSFVYSNSNGDLIFLKEDFYEKFNITEIIKENIFDYSSDFNKIEAYITNNIDLMYQENQISSSGKGEVFLNLLIWRLSNVISHYIKDSNGNYDYEELIRECEVKLYNMETFNEILLTLFN